MLLAKLSLYPEKLCKMKEFLNYWRYIQTCSKCINMLSLTGVIATVYTVVGSYYINKYLLELNHIYNYYFALTNKNHLQLSFYRLFVLHVRELIV